MFVGVGVFGTDFVSLGWFAICLFRYCLWFAHLLLWLDVYVLIVLVYFWFLLLFD